MKIRYSLALIVAAITLGSAPALAIAAHAVKPNAQGHSPAAQPSPPATARAFGRLCQAESKKHVAGAKGTPFSQCVTAMAKVAANKSMSPAQACAKLSKKHVAGMKATPYSQCVVAAAHLRGNRQGTPGTH